MEVGLLIFYRTWPQSIDNWYHLLQNWELGVFVLISSPWGHRHTQTQTHVCAHSAIWVQLALILLPSTDPLLWHILNRKSKNIFIQSQKNPTILPRSIRTSLKLPLHPGRGLAQEQHRELFVSNSWAAQEHEHHWGLFLWLWEGSQQWVQSEFLKWKIKRRTMIL